MATETLYGDREKWLKWVEDEPDIPVTSLAVLPFFFVTLRKHPEVDGTLPELAARLVLGIDQFERKLGGGGVVYDQRGSVETDTELKLRLVVLSGGWEAFERMDKIHAMLNELAAKARTDAADAQAADLRQRIAAALDSPIPREVAARLEPVGAG